jgi:hypothetical protein
MGEPKAKSARSIGSALLAGLVALAVVSSTFAVVGAAAGETTLDLTTTDDRIATGETTTYDVAVASADGGVGAYELEVELGDATVGSVVNVEPHGDPGWTDIEIADDGSRASITAAGADTDQTGAVTIVSVTVQGDDAGSTGLDLVVDALGDEQGDGYDVQAANGAELSVYEPDRDDDDDDDGSDETADESSGASDSGDSGSDTVISTTETTEPTGETSLTTSEPATDDETTATESAADSTMTTEAQSGGSDSGSSEPILLAGFLLVAVLAAFAVAFAVAVRRN